MANLDDGSGGQNPWRELFRRFLHPKEPRLLDKVDFSGLVAAGGRAAVGAVFVGISTVVLVFWDGVQALIQAGEAAVRDVLLAVGLSPTLLQRPAQVATTEAVQDLGAFALPAATAAQLASFGVIALVIALAWGFD